MARLEKPRFTQSRLAQPRLSLGPWPDGPWWLLVAASFAAPVAVLWQGGDVHVALLASLACLATPAAAIEAMMGLARLALAVAPPPR